MTFTNAPTTTPVPAAVPLTVNGATWDGLVKMRCRQPGCRAHHTLVYVEREMVTFAVQERIPVLCRDCRHPMAFITNTPTQAPA